MKHLKLFLVLMLTSILSIGQVWAEDVVAYTLTPASTGGNSSPHNSYAAAATITIDGIEWSVMGNSSTAPWRLGGKKITDEVRPIFSQTAIADNITKVIVEHGALDLTSASVVLKVYSTKAAAADGGETNLISSVSGGSVTANTPITFNRPTGHDWTGRFYRFEYSCTYTPNSNKKVEFSKATFYMAESGSNKSNLSDEQLAWSASEATVTYNGSSNSFPSLTNTENVTVTYESTNTAVATIASNGTITLKKAGNTTIKSIFAGNDDYNEKTVTYELTVNCGNPVTVTKGAETNGTYTLSATSLCGDGDGEDITISAISPASGYTFDEITTSASGTVDNDLKKVTGITANTTITVKFKALPKYTVSFNVGGSTATVDSKTEASAGSGIDLPVGPTPTCSADDWEFAGWAESAVGTQTTDAPAKLYQEDDNYKPAGNCTLYAVYKKTESGNEPAEIKYIKTELEDITSTDKVVITETKTGTYAGTYALPNDNGTNGAPAAVSVTLSSSGDEITSTVEDRLLWNISKDGSNLTIYPNGTTTTWLYTTGTNNGVRVGGDETNATPNKTWSISKSYLMGNNTSRYMGVYNSQDWRAYELSNGNLANNVKDQVLAFFVKTELSSSTTYYFSNPTCVVKTLSSVTVSGDATTKEYEPGSAFDVAGLVATAHYSDNSSKSVTATWTISTAENGIYYALDANEAKLVKGTTSVWVKATYEDKTSAAHQVTGLSVQADVTDEQLKWSATSGAVTLTVEPYTYPNLTNSLGLTLTYQSTNEDAATIDSNGDITLVAAGETTIKAVFAGNATYKAKTVSYTLTVNPAPVAVTGVSLNKSSLTLTEGANETLVATVAPNDATNKTVSWSSSAEGVATVDANGKVVAVAEGEATITVTTTDGEFKATCTVTVEPAVYFVKVTTAPSDWSGEYLIVYEDGPLAFNGGLETLDAVSNTIAVTISEGKILSTEATEAAKFEIIAKEGGYSLKSASGKYIGVSSNSNGLKQADTDATYTNDFSLDAYGNAVISAVFENASMTMRYNSASNQSRFRYYGSGQQAIQLYRKSVSSAVTVTNPGHGTIIVKAGEEAIGAKVQNGTVLTVSIPEVAGYRFALKAYKTSDVNTVVAIDNEGKLTMPAYPITITADETPLYTVGLAIVAKDKNDNVQEGAQGNTATINGGSADVIVAATDSIALVATPAAGYDFVNWTSDQSGNIAFRGDNASAANTKAVASANMTITANFKKKPCTTLGTPEVTVADADITYNSATLAWEAISNAAKYEVKIGTSVYETTDPSYTASGLNFSTEYTYQVRALAAANQDDYCDGQFSAEANFTTKALPKATLTLTYPSGTHTSSGEYTILTAFNLPCAAAVEGCPKTFVGWDANPECASAPTYAAGASFTFENTTGVTLYAVYADLVSEGSTSYNKTALANIESGSEVVITELYSDKIYAAANDGGTSEGPKEIELTETADVLNVGNNTNIFWILTKDEDNFSFTVKDGTDKLYCTNTNNGVRVGTNENNVFSISNNYLYNNATSRYVGYNHEQGGLFRCYTTINNNINNETLAFYKKVTTPAVYENYSTECVACKTVTLSAAEVENGSIKLQVNSEDVESVTTCEAASVAVVATPAKGYELSTVNLDGTAAAKAVYANNVISIEEGAEGALTATAVFAKKKLSVSMEQVGGANAELSANQSNKHYGDLISISTTVPTGYQFIGWTPASLFVNAETASAANTVFSMPDENVTVTAKFQKILTVAEARDIIDNGTTEEKTGVYVTGIVSKITTAYNSQYGNISYEFSTNGTTEADQIRAYRGKSFNGEGFTSEDDIVVGDSVVVKGDLTTFGSNPVVYELDEGNQLVSYVAKAVKNIAVKTAPTKVTYKEDDHFDPTGLVITASYTVGQPQDIAYEGHESDFTFAPALTDALVASNEAVVVTITYGGKTATQEITVNAKQNYIVTITTPENGSVVVKNGENEIESGVTEILEGTTLTIYATADDDYAVDKIYVNGEVIEGNTFELSAATTVNVTFKSQKAYTVSFSTGEGNSAQADIKEDEFGAGIDLPGAPTMSELCVAEGWTFAGWATEAVATEQAAAPAMLDLEEKFHPTDDVMLYAVYQKGDDATSDSKTFTFSEIASAEGWENGVAYNATIAPVTITHTQGGNHGKYYTSDATWRMYSGGTVTITAENASVTSVTSTPAKEFTIAEGVATYACTENIKFTAFVVGYSTPSTKVYLSAPTCEAPQCTTLGTPVVEVADADITHNSAKLTWAAVDNAAKYAVKIGENEAVETTDLFYNATELEAETEYAYQVKALAAANQDDYCDGEYTEVANFTTKETPAPVVTGNFKLFSGELVEGDYVIYYNGKAMKNTVASDRLEYAEVTPAEDKIENPVAAIIWHIAQSGEYWTIYNAAVNAYAASTGVKSKAQLLADGTDDQSLWTVSGDATYDIVNKANAANEINAYLRNNGTYGFACYAEGTGGALSLYKMMAPTHTVSYTVGENGSAVFSVDNNAEVEEGETVTITPTADQYYRVKAVTVLDGNADEVTVAESAGVYSFVMPESAVEANVTFELIPVTSVSVEAALNLVVEQEQTLTATVLPAEARATVTWESSNTAVATVDANGKVTAVAAGEATIKATSTVTTTVYGECVVTVSAASGHAITISEVEGGTVTANVNPADVLADVAVTLTATPADGYSINEWTIVGVEEEDLTISEDKTTCSFVMPNSEVLAEASFTHEVAILKLSYAGDVVVFDSENTHYWMEEVTLPTSAPECSRTFVGWSAESDHTAAPEIGGTYAIPNKGDNNILYAVYADVAEVVSWDEITTVPTAGEYAICSDANFMKAYESSSRLANGDAAPEIANNQLTVAPAANCIWEVSINAADKYLFKNGANYAAANGTKNQATLNTNATDTKAQWTIAYNNGFVVTNVHNAANNVNATLRNNGTYGWAAYGESTGSAPRFFKKNISAGAASNYSTECAAIIPQPTAVATPASVNATADAVAQTTITIAYENVNLSGVTMNLYNNAACTEAYEDEWLTASLDDNKQVVYSIEENTSYNNAREAYIKVVAPQTDNLTDPAEVIIPVSQAKKAAEFASLEDLVAADVAANTNVTVSFEDVVIKEIYMYNSNRRGLVFDIQKDEADIKIYFNADVPAAWVAGGKVSGTLTNCPWKIYSNAWQLAPASGWAWDNLTYTEPAAVKTVAITGGEPQKAYVDGEKFNPAGLNVRVTYTDDSYEDNPVGVTFSEATLAENQTSVEITATYNNVTSEAYTVTELTVGPIQVKSIEDFIADEGGRCYLEGIVSNYTNTTKGYFDLTDASGTIYIYGCDEPSSFEEGDKIRVIAEVYELYNSKSEAKNVEYVATLDQAVENVALDITEKAIFVEDQFTLTATIAPAKATNKNVTWSSSDDAIATVVDGVVTGVAAGEATITVTTVDGEHTATCVVTVSEEERNTLTLMVNGGVYRSIKALVGASVWEILGSITDPDISGYNFKGWSLTEAEEVLTEGTAGTLDADMTLYAVYAKGNVTYVKVTETSAITSGQYLIVYEGDNSHDAVAFNGALETLDAASNTIPVTINEGVINGNNSTNMAEFTIGSTGTIRSKSGYYIARTTNSNGMNVNATAGDGYTHTFSIDDSGNAVITSSGNPTLRYNYASDNLRFRYYKSGQQAIALYKRTDGAESAPVSNPTITVEENEVINVSDVAAEGVPVSIVVENGGTMNIDQTTIATNITAKDGATINVNEETTAENIVVENGGKIVTNAPTTTPTVYFATTMGAADNNGDFHGVASELGGVTNITLAQGGEIIYDLTLGTSKAGVQADKNQWHAFSLPFEVDALNGIYDAETGLKLTNEVNYAIMDYHGDIRANGDYGWKKYRGTLQPGTFYLMTVDGNTTTFRFKATQAGQMDQTNSMSAKAYDGTGADTDKGWNGFGNPRWIEGAFGHDAQYLDPYTYEYITIIPGMTIPVGLPFFYKASTTSDVQMDEVGTTYAPARSKAYEIKNVAVRFGNEESKDKLYISASEDALNEYEQDKDLVKMFMSQTPNVARISGKAYGMKLAKVYAPMVNDQAEYSLTLYAPQAGEYTISVSEVENADIYLTHEGTIIWNLSMGAYTNDFAKGNTEGYGLLLVKKAPSVATGVDSAEANEAGVQKVIIEDKVFILRGGQMYDVTGKAVR